MPYSTNAELPDGVKGALPADAQSVWRAAFNSAAADGGDDQKASKIAWGAVKNAGWQKDQDGTWRKVKKFAACRVAKIDEEKHLVFGWANVHGTWDGKALTLVEDSQGSMIEEAELEGAAYVFCREARGMDERHDWERCGYLVESVMITNEKLQAMFPNEAPPEGNRGWWIGMQPDPPVWEKFKSGEYRGFSIGGVAEVEPVEPSTEGGSGS